MLKWNLIAILIFGAMVWMLWPRAHSASATPENKLRITMSIRPMNSIHSDWYRKISIVHKGRRANMNLVADTGWWRGSNLYQHNSGIYVIHEGQNGCFAFTIEPVKFVSVPTGACTKRNSVRNDLEHGSPFYQDLTYLGHFQKTYRDSEGIRLRFLDASQTSEPELPDIL